MISARPPTSPATGLGTASRPSNLNFSPAYTTSAVTTGQVQTPYHRFGYFSTNDSKATNVWGAPNGVKFAADLEKTIPTSSHAWYWMATFSLQGNLNSNPNYLSALQC